MSSKSPIIKHIYVSPAHNFVGHFNGEPGDYPITEVAEAQLTAGSGVVGDRYFNHKPDYKGQITFFAWETYLEIQKTFDRAHVLPSIFRRNVITENLDLNALIGTEFEVQGIRFFGTEESRPCKWMNRVVAEGAKVALEGRGGLRARILTDGVLRPGPCRLVPS